MTDRREGARRRRHARLVATLVAAALCAGTILVLPGSASASDVSCRGHLSPSKDAPVPDVFDYQFACDDQILGYSIITNRSTDYFDTEPVVFVGNPKDNNASNDAFSCEGFIPGNGVGCNGKATPDASSLRWVVGGLGYASDPCVRHAKGQGVKVWLTVVTTQHKADGSPYAASSQPFRLGGACAGQSRAR